MSTGRRWKCVCWVGRRGPARKPWFNLQVGRGCWGIYLEQSLQNVLGLASKYLHVKKASWTGQLGVSIKCCPGYSVSSSSCLPPAQVRSPPPPSSRPSSWDYFLSIRVIGPARGTEENVILLTSKSLETPSFALIIHNAASTNPRLRGDGSGRHVEVRQCQPNDLVDGVRPL